MDNLRVMNGVALALVLLSFAHLLLSSLGILLRARHTQNWLAALSRVTTDTLGWIVTLGAAVAAGYAAWSNLVHSTIQVSDNLPLAVQFGVGFCASWIAAYIYYRLLSGPIARWFAAAEVGGNG